MPITKSDCAFAVIVDPPMVITAGAGVGLRIIVEPPITMLDASGARDIGVPEIVTAEAPGNIVCVPITNSDRAFAVTVDPPNVMTAGTGVGAAPRTIVEVPMTMFEAYGAKEMGVPEIVIAEAPGTTVCVPMTALDCPFRVIIDPTKVVNAGAELIFIVELPTTRFATDGPRDIGVPDMVIAGPPGISVCVPMMKLDCELAVMLDPSKLMTLGNKAGAGLISNVDDPITMFEADCARDTNAPPAVMAGAPGTRVCDPMRKLDCRSAVTREFSNVMTNGAPFTFPLGAGLNGIIDDPTRTAAVDAGKEIVVPDTTIAGPPMTSVCDATMN